MVGQQLVITAPTYLGVKISVNVFSLTTSSTSDVETRVRNAITNFLAFSNQDVSFGTAVRLSDIYQLIEDQDGVSYSNITQHELDPNDVITYSTWSSTTATIQTITTTAAVTAETWTITVTDGGAGTFTVTGSVSGLQANIGTRGVLYTTDDSAISFTVDDPSSLLQTGDYATFRTSLKTGDVVPLSSEIPTLELLNITVASVS